MSDKQNLAYKLIETWQEQTQEYLKDPRVAEIMTENYSKFLNLINATYEQSNSTDTTSSYANDTNSDNELSKLTLRIDELERRIKILETVIAKNS
jgi:hypothetical protein